MNLRFWRTPENLILLPIALLVLAAYSPVLVTSIAIITNFIALFWGYGQQRRYPWPARDFMLWLTGFLGWAFITCWWSLAPMKGLQSGILITAILLGGSAAIELLRRAAWPSIRWQQLQELLFYSVAIGLLLIAIEIFFGQPVYRLLRLANGIKFSEDFNISVYNRAITVFDLLLWPAAYAAWQHKKKWLIGLMAVTALAISLYGQSMSALLGLVLGIGVFGLAMWQPVYSYHICRVMVIIGFVGIFTGVNIIDKIPYLQSKTVPRSISQRVEIWDFAARRAQRPEHLLQGYGLESSRQMPNLSEHSQYLAEGENIIPIHPHDFILHIWLELGAIGAALGSGLLLTLLKHLQNMPRHLQRIAFPCFATAFGIALTAYGLWTPWWLAAFILAALAILITRPSTAQQDTLNKAGFSV